MIAPPVENEITAIVRDAIRKNGARHEALLSILSAINSELGYIPSEAFQEMRQQLNDQNDREYIPEGQIYSLASFYDMLSTKPRGEHVIKFCENAPCHVVGGKAIWEALSARLNLNNGETSPDSKWTLVTTSCLGLCNLGPVLLVDDDMYGHITPEQIPDILGRYE